MVLFRATPEPNPKVPESKANIGAFLILEPFNPTPGFPAWSPDMRIEVSGLENWTIAGSDGNPINLGFQGTSTNVIDAFTSYYEMGATAEFNGLAAMFFYNNGTTTAYKTAGPLPGNGLSAGNHAIYPFSNAHDNSDTGCAIVIQPPTPASGKTPAVASTCTLYGAPLTINIYSNPTVGNPLLLQTLTMPFPTAGYTIPVPTYPVPNPANTGVPTIGGVTVAQILNARLKANDGGHHDDYTRLPMAGSALIDPGDVVRSVIVDPTGPSKGDYG